MGHYRLWHSRAHRFVVRADRKRLVHWQGTERKLQQQESQEASQLRRLLVRLSGRLMKHKVESTAPALLAVLEKLLAWEDVLSEYDAQEILALARKLLPKLFDRRKRPPPVK